MTNRYITVLAAIVCLLLSFALRMELLSFLSFAAIYFALQPTKDERRADEQSQRAADIAHKHTETYTVELAKMMARKEAELRGLMPDEGSLNRAEPRYTRTKSTTSPINRGFH